MRPAAAAAPRRDAVRLLEVEPVSGRLWLGPFAELPERPVAAAAPP